MDAALYVRILSDKKIFDLKKIGYKYPEVNLQEFIELLKISAYKTLPICDFNGNEIVYVEELAKVRTSSVKTLMMQFGSEDKYGVEAMENEISSTMTIEDIEFSKR